jgi:signal transduction histidine kinase
MLVQVDYTTHSPGVNPVVSALTGPNSANDLVDLAQSFLHLLAPFVLMTLKDILFKPTLPTDELLKRKTVLGTYLFIMSVGVQLFFAVVNNYNPRGGTDQLMLLGGVGFSLFCLLLLRYGWVNISIVAHLLFFNAMAFLFTFRDPDRYLTGTYLFFIPAILWVHAIFGYKERWIGFIFSGMSFCLFLLAIFEPAKFHFADAHFFFITNFAIIMTFGAVILIYYDRQVLMSEKALRDKNAELEKTNMELDRFVYSASHDLRAPISSLMGLIQLYQLSEPHDKDKMVQLMESRIRKLDDFVREIIQYSRNARQEINALQFKPFELANDCWERLRFIPQKMQVQFFNQTDPFLEINHDADRLRMMIENLISNSIKYAKARTEPSQISVRIFVDCDKLNIEVEDNGEGIAKDKLDKVFDMFYRAHENSDGSGLGLYIVRETVNKMKGDIALTSGEGHGTSVKIKLPLIKAELPDEASSREINST